RRETGRARYRRATTLSRARWLRTETALGTLRVPASQARRPGRPRRANGRDRRIIGFTPGRAFGAGRRPRADPGRIRPGEAGRYAGVPAVLTRICRLPI